MSWMVKRDRPADAVEQLMQSLESEGKNPSQRPSIDRRELGNDELTKVNRLWQALGGTAAAERLAAPSYRHPEEGSTAYSDWLKATGEAQATSEYRRPLALAAGAALVACAAVWVYFSSAVTTEPLRTYSTVNSETRSIILADGSRLTIGPRSELSIDYNVSRRVVLLQRGEAMFTAARDPTRPFVVLAGSGSITALGTQFDVRREVDEDRVIVTVSEGAVEVAPPPADTRSRFAVDFAKEAVRSWMPARLAVGQQITYDRKGPTGATASIDVGSNDAWVDGRLEYRETPLSLVIPRVSRYSQKRIVLGDRAAGELPFSGIIFVDRIDEWRRALQTAYPVEIREESDRFVIRSHPAADQ